MSNEHHDRYWRIPIWVDKALQEPVKRLAQEQGISVNALVTRLLTRELEATGTIAENGSRPMEAIIADRWVQLGLPIRAAKALARAGVTIDLAGQISDAELLAQPSVGQWAVDEARKVVPAPPSTIERFHAAREQAAAVG